jgi:hypothetical protein
VLEHIATSKWFPSIAELRDAMLEKYLCLPTADEAFAMVSRHERDLSPIALAALKRCGGQWEFRNSTQPTKWRDDFRRNYNELVAKEKKKLTDQSLKRLRGRNPIARLEENAS